MTTIKNRAIDLFGRAKYDQLVRSFRHSSETGGTMSLDKLEYTLRCNGLCPTLAEISEIKSKHRCSLNLDQFLEVAIQCESVSSTCGMSELIDFFAPFDLENRGLIRVKIFMQLMRNCGERFSDREIDEVIEIFQSREHHGFVDYRAFLTSMTGIH